MRRFDRIWRYDGAAYSDLTPTLGSGSAAATLAAGEKLYLGHRDWLAGVLLFVSSPPSSPADVAVETWDGAAGAWAEIPAQERYDQLESGHQLTVPGYDFTRTGVLMWGESPHLWTLKRSSSTFPESKAPPADGLDLYWVRLRNRGASAVTIDRALPALYNTYADAWQVARFMGLRDFDDFDAPTAALVRERIRTAEDWLDQRARKSWRLQEVLNERHSFNAYGIHLDRYPVLLVSSVGFWQGTSFFDMTEGRNKEWYVTPETGMLYFTLPSFRLRYYSFLLSRYLRQNDSVQVSYVAGADFDNQLQTKAVNDVVLKRVGADLVQMLDWTAAMVGNPDALPKPEKARAWREEAEAQADELRGLLLA